MSKHTPGPWRFEISHQANRMQLCGGKPTFDLIVIDFVRWGMNGAQARFRTGGDDMNIMVKSSELSEPLKGREHHANWYQVLSHPDAKLIEAAPLMLEMLQEIYDNDGKVNQERYSRLYNIIQLATKPLT